jgi:hypothetical protein
MSQDKATPDAGKPRSSNSGLIIALVLIVVLLCLPTLVIGGFVVVGGAFAFWAVDRQAAPMNNAATSMPADGVEWNEPAVQQLPLPAESEPIAPPSQYQE